MAEINIKIVKIYIVVCIGLSQAIKFTGKATWKVLQGRLDPSLIDNPEILAGTLISQIIDAYNERQTALFKVNEKLSANVLEGSETVRTTCGACQDQDAPLPCVARCISSEFPKYGKYHEMASNAVDNFICKGMGYRFYDKVYSTDDDPIWTDLKAFIATYDEFGAKPSTPEFLLYTDMWLGNLALLANSPMIFYSSLQAKFHENVFGDQSLNFSSYTPQEVALKCDNSLAQEVGLLLHSLFSHIREDGRGYLMDIAFKGYFITRSSFFYVNDPSGMSYKNPAGAIVEAMNAIIGRKCDLIDEDRKGSADCDNFGRIPVPQFPIPLEIAEKLDINCNPTPVSTPLPTALPDNGDNPVTPEGEQS